MAKYVPKIRQVRLESDPVLREKTLRLTREEILSPKMQQLVKDIKFTCDKKSYGVGMSACQVGEPVALSVIAIKPTPSKPNIVPFDEVCFNLEIIETLGDKIPLWEGCCSILGEDRLPVYAQVPRHKRVRVKFLDGNAQPQTRTVSGFVAHVVQHEADHINGILFTDYVNRGDLISTKEYLKRAKKSAS